MVIYIFIKLYLQTSSESKEPSPAHNQKPEHPPEAHVSCYGAQKAQKPSMHYQPPFDNSFYLEYQMAPDYMIPANETKIDQFPIDYSAQKYYETVANNFEAYGFFCEEGFTYIPYPNPHEYNGFNYQDYSYVTDVKTEVKNESEDMILDLSKDNTEDIEQCSQERFNEVSNRICNELAKII